MKKCRRNARVVRTSESGERIVSDYTPRVAPPRRFTPSDKPTGLHKGRVEELRAARALKNAPIARPGCRQGSGGSSQRW